MSQKSGFLIVLNGFFIENVGHTLTKNYNGTYWPLDLIFATAPCEKVIIVPDANYIMSVIRKFMLDICSFKNIGLLI